ncbi:Cyclin-dependent kinase C-1 [Tritrichomonas foetus]|uniref:cyclin-dependent kinase n=1 Tax=Tritrichomonas foetus TaxID=1144522 RepID=A0A1J4JA84_9EUKA|nr:Cyclin-dependent kinase C-1 [Tritrichomonas foetus]|eukprot:OHS95585.1 Cyclin-dependent kinase C-1 [Tritrichomonas foetus]
MFLRKAGFKPIKELYDIISVVGKGAYGEVYKARSLKTFETVAMKKINRKNSGSEGFPVTTFREIMLLKSLNHPNVANLIEIITDTNYDVYLVFEYTEYDLDYLLRRVKLSIEQVKSFMRQMLFGLYAIHQRYIFHRDLKPQNILVKNNNVIQIADFGLAKQISPNQKERMTPTVITIYYRPLELFFTAPKYTQQVDIWSLGCIFFEMMTNRQLFVTKNVVKENNDEANEMAVVQQIFTICGYPDDNDWPGWRDLPKASLYLNMKDNSKLQTGNLERYLTKELPPQYQEAKPILLGMLQFNPEKRLSIEEILTNPYLHSIQDSLEPQNIPLITMPTRSDKMEARAQAQANATTTTNTKNMRPPPTLPPKIINQ